MVILLMIVILVRTNGMGAYVNVPDSTRGHAHGREPDSSPILESNFTQLTVIKLAAACPSVDDPGIMLTAE
jgi:hypothetical protein